MQITFIDLLNNAVEYYKNSLSSYKSEDYKSAVSDLWTGTLLLLKCKLFNIHPVLLVSDILDCLNIKSRIYISSERVDDIEKERQFSKDDKSNIKAQLFKEFHSIDELYKACNITNDNKKGCLLKYINEVRESFDLSIPDLSKDLKTVTIDEILKRFKQLKEPNRIFEKYSEKLQHIRIARNRLEHYVNDFKSEQLLAMFEYAIPFINDFLEDELNIGAETAFDNWSEFLEISQIAEARKATVEKFVSECQSSIDYRHGDIPLNESECTLCGNISIDNGEGYLYFKFCGNKDEYNICSECGEVFPKNGYYTFHEDIGMCDDCLMYKVDKD